MQWHSQHGSNDVANAIGPLSSVVSIVQNGGKILSGGDLAWWILPLGALGIAVGLIAMGQKVMATVGSGITDLTLAVVLLHNLQPR